MSAQLKIVERKTDFDNRVISDWVRNLGFFNCTDIDWLVCPYDHSEPKALIEWKHENAPKLAPDNPSISCMRELATRARVPFFVVRWCDDLSHFIVHPLNIWAWKFCTDGRKPMSEETFKRFLKTIVEAI